MAASNIAAVAVINPTPGISEIIWQVGVSASARLSRPSISAISLSRLISNPPSTQSRLKGGEADRLPSHPSAQSTKGREPSPLPSTIPTYLSSLQTNFVSDVCPVLSAMSVSVPGHRPSLYGFPSAPRCILHDGTPPLRADFRPRNFRQILSVFDTAPSIPM